MWHDSLPSPNQIVKCGFTKKLFVLVELFIFHYEATFTINYMPEKTKRTVEIVTS